MTTPHLVEPPSLAGAVADVELSPMSRRRYRGSHMRIIGMNAQELASKTVQFMRAEEACNAQPVWMWIPETDVLPPKVSVRCEIAGIQFGGEVTMRWLEDWTDEERCSALDFSVDRITRQLEQMVARFVLYGAR